MPIEPEKTTKLIDDLLETFEAEEVWFAGVPGAGGHDAIFVIGPPATNNKTDFMFVIREFFCKKHHDTAILPVLIV